MKRIILVAAVVVVAAVVIWRLASGGDEAEAGRFEFAEVERGDIENIISSTGTLSAVGTVEVGTQVSGTIDRILVDYNETVRSGQVLAVLDTTMLAASVRDARAGVLRARALYDQAKRDFERQEDLHERELISDADFQDARTSVETARATLMSSEASLDRARANRKYAVIRSPIDGTVIMRNVEPGQTVAASFSTPTLFVIAEDMEEMEIHALVDESDIGEVRVGQSVRFTVEAYVDEVFDGTVRQIWLQPEVISNVVTYTVVVDAKNDRGLLYPGMTATTDFLVEERHDVLLVPNAAVRLRATPAMYAELRESMEARIAEMPEEERAAMEERMAAREGATPGGAAGSTPHVNAEGSPAGAAVSHPSGASGGPPGAMSGGLPGDIAGSAFGGPGGGDDTSAMLWYLDDAGRLAATRVKKGVTDGRNTEIIGGRGITEGMQVIVAVNEPEESNGSSNPLVTGPFGRRRG